MPAERYYIDAIFLSNQKLEMKGAEFHHLAHVMRTRQGEKIELVNGKGVLAQGIVNHLMKDTAIIYLEDIFEEDKQPHRLILAQAIPKQNRLELILEKGTELGVDQFWLFPGHLSQKKEFYPQHLERVHSVLIAAMKQCGRLTLPEFHVKPSIEMWPPFASTAFFGDLSLEAPSFEKAYKNLTQVNFPLIFITGPESGFDNEEIDSLRQRGAEGVKLHSNILRTDTASIAAMSLLSHWLD